MQLSKLEKIRDLQIMTQSQQNMNKAQQPFKRDLENERLYLLYATVIQLLFRVLRPDKITKDKHTTDTKINLLKMKSNKLSLLI